MGLLSIIFQNKSMVSVVFLLLILGGVYFYISTLKSKIEKLDSELSMSKAQIIVLQSSNSTLKKSIDDQNRSVEDLKDQAAKREETYKLEIAKARENTSRAKKRADDLANATPPPGVPLCDAANDLFNQEIRSK